MSGLEKAFHIHTWNFYSSQSLPTAACWTLWKSSHEALTLDYRLVLLLGVISKIHFVRKSYRVAALNKAMLYQRKEQKQTKPWALNQMSYCVYHIKLKLNSGKNTLQWNSSFPPTWNAGRPTLSPPWGSTPMQWLQDFTVIHASEFPKVLWIPNPEIQQLFGKARTYWLAKHHLVRKWKRLL